MAKRTEQRVIDGLTFEVTQLDPKRSQRLLLRVMGMLSGALGRAVSGLGGAGGGGKLSLRDLDVDFSKVGEAIPALFEKFTPEQFEELQKELLTYCTVERDGKWQQLWPVFDLVMAEATTPFAGLKLALFAFEVNYGNFSEGLGARVRQMLEARAASPGSNTSQTTGPSGG